MKFDLIKIISLVLLILNCSYNIGKADELIQVPAAIHISSTISDGQYSIPEIAEAAKSCGIKVVVITDRDLMRWQYGLWPLRNIIRKIVESNSILKYGIRRYLKEIERAQDRYQDMIILPGTESAPFYYWQGSPFNQSLKICNWHKHILVMGLEKAEDYEYLPVTGNQKALYLPFRMGDIYRLWPVLVFVAGVLCLFRREFKYQDLTGRALGPYSKIWRICGALLILIGLIFSYNNYPFREFKFDNYKGDLGIRPYQNFIDYVNLRGGMTFWAHPEAYNIQSRGSVGIETRGHSGDLLEARDYTGFAVFYEGYREIGRPGGIWDELLRQYCRGERKAPIWAIAGLSYDYKKQDLGSRMMALRTVFLVPELSKPEVLGALRNGRMYALRGKESWRFLLDKFEISDISTGNKVTIGGHIDLRGKPLIHIKGNFIDGQYESIKIRLIKNGQIIKAFQVNAPFDISYQEEEEIGDKGAYYRLEIASKGLLVVTNPIFVEKNPAPF